MDPDTPIFAEDGEYYKYEDVFAIYHPRCGAKPLTQEEVDEWLKKEYGPLDSELLNNELDQQYLEEKSWSIQEAREMGIEHDNSI